MAAARLAVLLALWPHGSAAALLYHGSKVVELDVHNFKRYTSDVPSGEISIVEAYVSWCPHCIRMSNAYRLFAAEAEPWAPAIHVTAVDCVAHDLLCRDLGVWGYPTLFLFGDLRGSVSAIDNEYSRVKHEGAFAEGYPAHAIRELWQWTLSWATPRAELVSTPDALTQAKQRAHAAGVPLVLFVRSDWDPSTEQFGAPPPPLAPVPMTPPPAPAPPAQRGAAAPTPPPAPPEDSLAPLFGDWVDLEPDANDRCAALSQPECLDAAHGCEPVIDCWNAHWPSSCHWWHEKDGWAYEVLKAAGCPCRCRSPNPPPPPSPPPPPPRPPPRPPQPPSPPLLAIEADSIPPPQQVHLLAQLAYELAPMRFAEWVGPPPRGMYSRFGLAADEEDTRMPAIVVSPEDGGEAVLFPFDVPRYEAVAEWLASFQGGRKRGGMPSTARAQVQAKPLSLDSGALAVPQLAHPDAPPVWPLPDAEIRASVIYGLEAFVFAGRDCLDGTRQADLGEWLNVLSSHLGFEQADSALLAELRDAVRRTPQNNLCFKDWAPMLRALRQSGFGAPHNLGDGSSACARGKHALTCTLWVLFHSLVAGSRAETGGKTLSAIHGFVRSFFACHECSAHFEAMVNASDLEVWLATNPSQKEVALWLWRAHNTVAVRVGLMDAAFLAAGSAPVAEVRVQGKGGSLMDELVDAIDKVNSLEAASRWFYPQPDLCPACYATGDEHSGVGSVLGDGRGIGPGGGPGVGELGYFESSLQANCPVRAPPSPEARKGSAGAEMEQDVLPNSKPARALLEACDESVARQLKFHPEAVADFLQHSYSRSAAAPRARPVKTITPPTVTPPTDASAGNAAGGGAASGGAVHGNSGVRGGAADTPRRESSTRDPFFTSWAAEPSRESQWAQTGQQGAALALDGSYELRPFGVYGAAGAAGSGEMPRGESERASPLWLLLFVGGLIALAAAASWALRRRLEDRSGYGGGGGYAGGGSGYGGGGGFNGGRRVLEEDDDGELDAPHTPEPARRNGFGNGHGFGGRGFGVDGGARRRGGYGGTGHEEVELSERPWGKQQHAAAGDDEGVQLSESQPRGGARLDGWGASGAAAESHWTSDGRAEPGSEPPSRPALRDDHGML